MSAIKTAFKHAKRFVSTPESFICTTLGAVSTIGLLGAFATLKNHGSDPNPEVDTKTICIGILAMSFSSLACFYAAYIHGAMFEGYVTARQFEKMADENTHRPCASANKPDQTGPQP